MAFLLSKVFADLARKQERALIAYVTAGFPHWRDSEKMIEVLIQEKVDILELGFPFSDPIADGPVIQKTSFQALQQGVDVEKCLELVRKFSSALPVLPMTYSNLVYAYGIERFARDLQEAGAAGAILADVSLEGRFLFQPPFQRAGLDVIPFASTLTPLPRFKKIVQGASGFLYCVSRPGTTGARRELPEKLVPFLKKVRALTKLPLCVGFGISQPEHIRKLFSYADGFIVGSALLAPYLELSFKEALPKMQILVRKLKEATYGAKLSSH